MSSDEKGKMVQQSFQNAPKPQPAPTVKETIKNAGQTSNTYGQTKVTKPFVYSAHFSSKNKYSTLGICVLIVAVIIFIAVASGVFGKTDNTSDTHSDPQSTAVPQGAWLTDLKYSDKDLWVYMDKRSDNYATDGNGYNHYLYTQNASTGSITYPLHGMYSSLTATWVLDANRANANADAGALQIFTDDSLAFSSSEISIEGQMYQNVYVDLTGCNILRIEFVGYHYNDGMFSSYGNIGKLNNIWLEPYMGSSATGKQSTRPISNNQNTNWNQPESVSIRQLPSVIECLDFSHYSITDQYGNEYKSYYDFCSYHENGYDAKQQYLILRPQGKWHYLRGRYFARPSQNDGFVICFQIFADDVLVYDSGMIDRNAAPVDFDIDIGYADTVRMQSYSDNYTFMGTNPGIILVNSEVHN